MCKIENLQTIIWITKIKELKKGYLISGRLKTVNKFQLSFKIFCLYIFSQGQNICDNVRKANDQNSELTILK